MTLRKTLLFLSLTLTIIGAPRLPATPKRKPIPPKTVVLTFDDAVKTHLTVVAPLLKQLGFRATFFKNGYHTLALRDLLQYYDSSQLPDDPLLKARCCAKTD